ncbi:hypothetical protein ACE193_08200 [Bernardetia sp. OM2101]|uniref:hypothetical protein n=1 Tax=Bernardetia sp. OM2101 TaxID=3344876 RepID=UPI0035D0CF02
MKYILIPFIALGLVLSLIIRIEYNCSTGQDMFPTYYASPFVFAEQSLGTSLERYYSVFGVIWNTLVWSIILIILQLVISKFIKFYNESKVIKVLYRICIGILIIFSSLSIAWNSLTIGAGFEEGFNYWYMDLDKKANKWGVKCEGKWKFWRWDF